MSQKGISPKIARAKNSKHAGLYVFTKCNLPFSVFFLLFWSFSYINLRILLSVIGFDLVLISIFWFKAGKELLDTTPCRLSPIQFIPSINSNIDVQAFRKGL